VLLQGTNGSKSLLTSEAALLATQSDRQGPCGYGIQRQLHDQLIARSPRAATAATDRAITLDS
jgi:hypothetical protein